MKHKLLIFISLLLFPFNMNAQNQQNTDSLWKEVKDAIHHEKPKTASGLLNRIEAINKVNDNAAGNIKVNIARARLAADFEEQNMEKTIRFFDSLINVSTFPEKNIYHSLAAELYAQYHAANDYEINKRVFVGYDEPDFTLWSRENFIAKSYDYHIKALSKDAELVKIPVEQYSEILEDEVNARQLRPTLYDLLAFRAIAWFGNPANNLLASKLNSRKYLAPCDEFVSISLDDESADDDVLLQCLKIYQNIIKRHLNEPEVLVDADIQRLDFVRRNTDMEGADELYLRALDHLKKQYDDNPCSTQATYAIANFHYQNLTQHDDEYDEEEKNDTFSNYNVDYVKIVALCDEAIKKHPESKGAQECHNLKNKIIISNIKHVKYQSVIYPNEHFDFLVSYKNCDKLHCRTIKMEYDDVVMKRRFYNPGAKEYIFHNKPTEKIIDFLKECDAIKTWTVQLKDYSDHENHTVEVVSEPLSAGVYVTLVSNNEAYDYEHGSVYYFVFQVSHINVMASAKQNKTYEFNVVDRNTGQYISNCEIVIYKTHYNWSDDVFYSKIKTYTADNKGRCVIEDVNDLLSRESKKNNAYEHYNVEFIDAGEKFFADDLNIYGGRNHYADDAYNQVLFYLDRKIYRPGQTLFFKGLMLSTKHGLNEVVAGSRLNVVMRDVNGEIIGKTKVVSNQYGSFSGTFTIPVGGMNGSYTISSDKGVWCNFNVEEYKRPTFEILFDKITSQPIANQSVKIKVTGKTYSGLPLAGAKVKYSVTRKQKSLWFWFSPISTGNVATILSGTKTADANGEVMIDFNAACPAMNNSRYTPAYDFVVHVDVTDESGETISDEMVVSVSEQTLFVYLDEKDVYTASDTININITNINGEQQDVQFEAILTRLEQPQTISRERLWHYPDDISVSKENFTKYFIHDSYDNLEISSLKKIGNSAIHYKSQRNIALTSLESGFYELEVKAKDDYGKVVSEKFHLKIFDTKKDVFVHSGIDVFVDETGVEAGDSVEVKIFVSKPKAAVRIDVTSPGRTIMSDIVQVDGSHFFSFDVKREDVDKIMVKAFASFDNRDFEVVKKVKVPNVEKKLEVKLLTHRDFLTPGGKETWTLSVLNHNGTKAMAEVLASMYDQSLDYFADNTFSAPSYGYFINNNRIEFCRGKISASLANGLSPYYLSDFIIRSNVYDEVDWQDLFYGLSYGSRRMGYYGSAGTKAMRNSDVVFAEAAAMSAPMVDDAADEAMTVEEKAAMPNEEKKEAVRSNFAETAFFYPQLETDSGQVAFTFELPESMTKWKFQVVAHTKDLASGYLKQEIIAKKDMYISANRPKVLYAGDEILYTAKVNNLSGKSIKGNASIKITDEQGKDVTGVIAQNDVMAFQVEDNQSVTVSWKLKITDDVSLLNVRTTASTDVAEDSEEYHIPVLPTKVLITETMAMTVNKQGSNDYVFTGFNEKFGNEKYLTRAFTFEYTPNPIWYAIEALPYLESGSDIVTDCIFSRLYCNLLASHLLKQNPEIEQVITRLKQTNPEEFESELEKNQELKDVILKNTPWVLDAENEQRQREQLVNLFNSNQLNYNNLQLLKKLSGAQKSDGGFGWLTDSRYSCFITTAYIVEGLARLNNLGVIDVNGDVTMKNLVHRAAGFLDKEIVKRYRYLKKEDLLDKYVLESHIIHYLYIKTLLKDVVTSHEDEVEVAHDYFLKKLEDSWQGRSLRLQALSAMTLYGHKNSVATTIMQSFDERALYSEEIGMYWRDLNVGNMFDFYGASVSTMASMIECYNQLNGDVQKIADMQRWLLNQKRTSMWKTNVGTTDAIYALLLGGNFNLVPKKADTVYVGNHQMDSHEGVPGTGYNKKVWVKSDVDKSLGNIKIIRQENSPAWAAAYWQYLTDFENVKSSATGLSVEKIILKSSYEDGTKVAFQTVKKDEAVKNVDKLVVRLIISTDRNMEYVHLSDVLPSCFIPEEVKSGFKYSNDLMYYMEVKDDAVNFFIERMNKGTYFIDYKVNIQQTGDFSAGISKIRSYYAPEFGGQSEGRRIKVTR